MNIKRLTMLYHKLRFVMIIDGEKRGAYLKKHHLLKGCGENLLFQSRNFPMNPELVLLHDNVAIAADVTFVTHDAIRHMLMYRDNAYYMPHMGCIEVMDNTFLGIGSTIMPNVRIGANSIVAAGSLVTKDVPEGVIVAGVPAKIIGKTEELIVKRQEETKLLENLKIDNETYYWEQFYEMHELN